MWTIVLIDGQGRKFTVCVTPGGDVVKQFEDDYDSIVADFKRLGLTVLSIRIAAVTE